MQPEKAGRVLLVEDTASMAMLYRKLLEKEGILVTHAKSTAEGRTHMAASSFDAFVLDLMLPDGSGLELLNEAQTKSAKSRCIVVTSDGSINRAVNAMRSGAFDFLVKPVAETVFVNAVKNALTFDEPEAAIETKTQGRDFHAFVGESLAMQKVYERLEYVGGSNAPVFITGESGTGKELAALALHRIGKRRDRPFIALNCGAIPAELLESEVFGHVAGAFTGAALDQRGAARAADGGTLFLDEICELPPALQTKLLRFLQTGTVTPVGGSEPIPVDARIVCATNRDPFEELATGRLREDLFYRIHVVPLHLPPLRERGGDILRLAKYFLARFALEERKHLHQFSTKAVEKMLTMRWPGNVRQLENTIRMIAALYDGPEVTEEMLPDETRMSAAPLAPQQFAAVPVPVADFDSRVAELVGQPLETVERSLIEATIRHCGDSIPKAAKILGVSPSTIYRRREGWES